MRFWDSSAIISLVVAEPTSERMLTLLTEDRSVVAWWATPLECLSAIARRERSGEMDPAQASKAGDLLTQISEGWTEVAPVEAVREVAARLIRVHDLRAADALQLAAASAASEGKNSRLGFVTLDDRLADAASREGFGVIGPGS